MIKAEHLLKHFGRTTAVNDISFEVETGKVTGFLGPNGAGKSTTMRLMLGLDNGSGTTKYDKKLLHEYARPAEVVGILLEAKAYHPTRTAKNHLKILAAADGLPMSRVNEVLETVGLKDVANRAPGKFSLGMSQRLGIAAAILAKPKHLLLDEPANGLDPEGIVWLREFLKNYAEQGNAVLVSSHLLSEMAQMADNVIVIGKGKLIANTSISALVSSSSKSTIFVRSNNTGKLKSILDSRSFDVKQVDGGLEVLASKTDEVGKIAHGAGLAILELTARNASLEDIFLELTEGQEEFRANVIGEPKS